MTTGDYRKDAQTDLKELRAKRPNDPPPTTAGKLPGGVKVENGPGNLIFVDMYPGYAARIQLPNSFRNVVIGNNDVVEVVPMQGMDDTLIIQAKSNNAPANGSPNSPTTVGTGGNGGLNGSNGYGSSATASMTNILVLNELGKEIANVMVTSLRRGSASTKARSKFTMVVAAKVAPAMVTSAAAAVLLLT
jgi:hypothetical protein